jgi:predicted phage-related endonuclease
MPAKWRKPDREIDMEIIECTQGDETWHAARAKHYCASDAAAMLGFSKYKSRNELLRQFATGIEADNSGKQWLFSKGHEAESAALPLVESQLQESLFPVVGTLEVDGLPLLASFDGINIETTLVWECKLWSAEIEAMIRADEVADTHWPQLEQQLLVSGAERVLFTGCDGEKINGQLWYVSNPERRARLIAGWKQFREDLANYTPPEIIPAAIATPTMDLPAIAITVSGALNIQSNFSTWGIELNAFIARIPEKPSTDQEFADCKAAVAALKKAEKQLDAEEERVLSQVQSIDAMKREKKLLRDLSSTTRLALEKLVEKQEVIVKTGIMQAGKDALAAHIETLNKRLATVQMPPIIADFVTAIKGKRNLESMRGAVDDLVAEKKIESNALADRMQININALDTHKEYQFLFPDIQQIIIKANCDFMDTVNARIAAHKEAERERAEAQRVAEEKRLEAERQKIRAEETQRAELAIAAAAREQQKQIDEARRNVVAEAAAIQEIPDCQKTKISTEPLKITGKVLEVGNLEDGSGRGVRLEADGEFIAIIGMSEDECRYISKWYGEEVEITISSAVCRTTQDLKDAP